MAIEKWLKLFEISRSFRYRSRTNISAWNITNKDNPVNSLNIRMWSVIACNKMETGLFNFTLKQILSFEVSVIRYVNRCRWILMNSYRSQIVLYHEVIILTYMIVIITKLSKIPTPISITFSLMPGNGTLLSTECTFRRLFEQWRIRNKKTGILMSGGKAVKRNSVIN